MVPQLEQIFSPNVTIFSSAFNTKRKADENFNSKFISHNSTNNIDYSNSKAFTVNMMS